MKYGKTADSNHSSAAHGAARIPSCILGLGLVLLVAGGCPSPVTRSSNPEDVLRAYAAAVREGKYDLAYDLMFAQFRKKYSRKDFERMLRENRTEVTQAVKKLGGKPKKVHVSTELSFGDDEKIRMVKEKGKWRIETDPIDFYNQRTPVQALRSFIRAIERKRYDIVLRFVPDKWSQSMTVKKLKDQWEGQKKEEVRALLKNLKANLSTPINQSGNSAVMPYGDKFQVRFIREDGIWKIEDPD